MPLRLAALSLLFVSPLSFAIDPFTVIAVGTQVVSTAQTIAGASKEAAEMASSLSILSELVAEIDSDSAAGDAEPNVALERLQEVERLAMELGYTRDEIEDLTGDSASSSQSLSATLSKVTRSIRLTKRLAALAGISSKKAAEVAEIEQARLHNDEKKILTQIYGQMIRSDLDAKRAELAKQKRVAQEVSRLQGFVAGIAPAGNLRLFPSSQKIVRKAIDVFETYSRYLLALVAVIFLWRLVYYEFSFAPAEKYTDLMRDAFVCFFLMIVFPALYGHMAEYSDALATKLSQVLHVAGPTFPEPKRVMGLALPWWIQPSVIQSVVYLVVYAFFNLVLAVLIALGPIAILTGTLLNFSISLPAYFAALLLIWMWPVMWNITGYFAELLWKGKDWSTSGIAESVAALLFWLFQLLSPVAVYRLVVRSQAGQVFLGAHAPTQTVITAPARTSLAENAKKVVLAKVSAGASALYTATRGPAAAPTGPVRKPRPAGGGKRK